VLQGGLAIEVAQEISDPQRGWICDLFDSMIEKGLPNLSRTDNCTENLTGHLARTRPTKKVSGLRFLCCCPQLVPFRTNGIGCRRLAPEDSCLLMSDLAESC
jgi:hypothetical protein